MVRGKSVNNFFYFRFWVFLCIVLPHLSALFTRLATLFSLLFLLFRVPGWVLEFLGPNMASMVATFLAPP